MSELNREQIIKALEYCKSPKLTKCYGCPREQEDGKCMYRLNEDSLALINELTEENERLKAICDMKECVIENAQAVIARTKADTVREMQERFSMILKKEYEENTPEGASFYFKNGSHMMWSIADRVFAQIAKEMVEDRNEESNYRN